MTEHTPGPADAGDRPAGHGGREQAQARENSYEAGERTEPDASESGPVTADPQLSETVEHGQPCSDGDDVVPGQAREKTAGYDVDSGIQALWKQFSDAPEQVLRDRLVLHYAPLVKYVAGRVGTGLPTHVDVGDLVQSGIFGLVDAIEKFEPARGLRFETYAMQRIRGAILDDLRSQDWVPRVVRSRAREAERALERLGARLHRTPTDAELAAELDITLDELRDLYGQLQLTSVVALEDLVAAGKESGSLVDTLPDDDAVDPVAVLVDQDNRRQLADAISQLTERDRIVVSLYYFESLTLAEIGKVLGVTESRVSQLHTRAVMRLRAKLVEQSGV
ncbi:FliA/WhiG family RNA polymerase sigma factor [Amycolatopsis xylanica]|uniref:FliA/WhiG family RNA polymerase sigma factor n=1 Tax=Amycolatopsis xylanica TaxID=589385 RepID=UPI0015A22D4A|nr:FliA/WhiG family RNA polymerase sigma factor [Amycolatopsis xylanica]